MVDNLEKYGPALEEDGDEGVDYTLKETSQSVWITVDSISVYIRRLPGGVNISTHPKENEATEDADLSSQFIPYPEEIEAQNIKEENSG